MSDLQSWGKTCESAYKQPLSQLLTTNWGMAGFVIASFLISAGASLRKFSLWFRASPEERKAMWPLFGYFAACCFTANLSGAIAFLANALMLDQFFRAYNGGDIAIGDKMSFISTSDIWQGVYYIFYSIEFLFLCSAMLIVLNRMLEFSLRMMHTRNQDLGALTPMAISKAVLYATAFINFIGFIGNMVTMAMNFIAAGFYSQSAAAFNSGQNVTGLDFRQRASIQNDGAQQAASVQQFCEVISLIIIIVSFTGTGVFCIKSLASVKNEALISTATQSSHPKLQAVFQRLRHRIFGTVAAVFVTFILRAFYTIFNAVAATGVKRGDNPECNLCDYTCQNIYDLIYIWVGYTPQFQLSIEFLSCPLASLIALWGMTNAKTMKQHPTLESSGSRSGSSTPYIAQ